MVCMWCSCGVLNSVLSRRGRWQVLKALEMSTFRGRMPPLFWPATLLWTCTRRAYESSDEEGPSKIEEGEDEAEEEEGEEEEEDDEENCDEVERGEQERDEIEREEGNKKDQQL